MAAGSNTKVNVGIRRMITSIASPEFRNFEVNGSQTYAVITSKHYSHAGNSYAKGQTIAYDAGGSAITAIAVSAGGTGYTVGPTVTLTGTGSGSGATFTVNSTGGVVTSVTVNTGGSGYPASGVTATFTGGAFTTPATAGAVTVSGGTLYSNQARLERDFNSGMLDPSS
jgi:hypothetical protein